MIQNRFSMKYYDWVLYQISTYHRTSVLRIQTILHRIRIQTLLEPDLISKKSDFFCNFYFFQIDTDTDPVFPGPGCRKVPDPLDPDPQHCRTRINFLLFSITMYCCGFGTFLSTWIRSEWILTKITETFYIFFC